MKPIFRAPIDTSVFSPSLAVFALMAWLNQEGELIPRFAGRHNRKEEAEQLLADEAIAPAFYTWIDLTASGGLCLEVDNRRIQRVMEDMGRMADRIFTPQEIEMAVEAARSFIDTYFITPWGDYYLGNQERCGPG